MGKSAIVVGGGIAGLYAGLLLTQKNYSVTLVEVAPHFGGLFQSLPFGNGVLFDHGIHYAIETGDADIDRVLFAGVTTQGWQIFDESLPEGHVFRGKLQSHSGCIDARAIDHDQFVRGLGELLTIESPTTVGANLKDELDASFGSTLTEEVYRIAMRKVTGKELEDLAPGSHRRFHIPRLIVLPSAPTKALKTVPAYDERIAFADIRDGTSRIRKFYPRKDGIGAWPRDLVGALEKSGASLRAGTVVERVSTSHDRITNVSLSDGTAMAPDVLVWTAPRALLTRAMGGQPPPPPKFRHVLLLHFLCRKTLTDRLHWISVYDDDLLSYRITLYRNLAPELAYPDGDRVTVEVLCDDPALKADAVGSRVADELVRLGIVDGPIMLVGEQMARNAFPISVSVAPDEPQVLKNLVLGGRDSSAGPFQLSVLNAIRGEVDRVAA